MLLAFLSLIVGVFDVIMAARRRGLVRFVGAVVERVALAHPGNATRPERDGNKVLSL